ncbi:hypothetical protein FEM48_Zijuj09G0045700 [Ziziphus jujuba var. spinosa]|uniref:Pentatricopeptide repeat-containing protein n=1 Tax=Ziziphus jujuba var. spinosa TaxID=714518 RepID=A0A978UQX5_ZIZJJ|nr:hypothetical protein FEM48_Zijuj09G0045700 [Ziziphus jujuba var. spinosa]
MLKKTHALQLPHVSHKPIKIPSLKGTSKQGSLQEAFQSFGQTSLQFCLHEAYSSVLERCASEKALSQGQQIHAHMTKFFSVTDSVFLSTKLLFMYGKCGSLSNAHKVFDRMYDRTIFTWNAIIGACVSNGQPLQSLELYREMRLLGVTLDSCTFPCIARACGMLNDLRYFVFDPSIISAFKNLRTYKVGYTDLNPEVLKSTLYVMVPKLGLQNDSTAIKSICYRQLFTSRVNAMLAYQEK